MTVSPYITAALERAALPISWCCTINGFYLIDERRLVGTFCPTPAEATRAYLALVETLSNPETSLPVSGSDGCSASSAAPEGAGL